MSGIVAIHHRDGQPVDSDLLVRLTASMGYRGPDAQCVWSNGSTGLGHTLFVTSNASRDARQPRTRGRGVWVTADVRLDDRDGLMAALRQAGQIVERDTSDADLILAAYAAWERDCVHHLLGDWAFVIWDTARRRVFGARDPLGVKPFFYARPGETLLISNTLACLRLHPDVSDRLNDLAIADFLLFNGNQELDTTAFADVCRLPGGHSILAEDGAVPVVERYWSLTQPADIRYRRSADYVEHFTQIFDAAVRDRVGEGRVAISMSGGLDSTAVAASARRGCDPHSTDLLAWTCVFDSLIPDTERHYASMAAAALRLPIRFRPADHYGPYDGAAIDGWASPEPTDLKFLGQTRDDQRALAAEGFRVVLTGFDADSLLRETPATYFAALRREGRYGRLLEQMASYVRWFGAVPPVGIRTAVRAQFDRALGREATRREVPPLPPWVAPDLAARLNLAARWHRYQTHHATTVVPRRRVLDVLPSATWRDAMEGYDAAQSLEAIEFRHPFADLRLVRFLLAIPAVPWCVEKMILRESFRGTLPEAVRRRPKTLLAGDRLAASLMRLDAAGASAIDQFVAGEYLSRYVIRDKIPPVTGTNVERAGYYRHLRPLNLELWFRSGFRSPYSALQTEQSVGPTTRVEHINGE